ncbi:hypothetical protein AMAG_10070 [Allomyces macrogynus ATCC 38327]|uniref:K Homology domain-containing protein n=1 Tax=Allomyces macrogynus (strain ATCC 38327) TaxID=578462 RepID=A0A0L0SQR6_ALLM3|nr:hypothetical protein AMAG_10070 [Allomyces macrogynus ATCC 38327]|eukprot:KNE64719.1 hypothetical protein AMAG_10070 [Allomyces macrogynus ATCC 38327]
MPTIARSRESRRSKWDQAAPAHSAPSAPAHHHDSPAPSSAPPRSIEEAKRLAALKAQELAAAIASPPSAQPLVDPPAVAGFTEDVDINDCRNRYLLTKSSTQQDIKRDSGADITTRGKYFPDRSKASTMEPPLHLHVSATTREALDKALDMIRELMNRSPDPLLSERHSFAPRPHRDRSPPPTATPTRAMLTDKVYVGWEPDFHFNLRAKIIGPGGAYVKHIQNETGVRLQLKGLGSGYTENQTGRESDEPLHMWMATSLGEQAMDHAKALFDDLLTQIKADYETWKADRARGPGGRGGPPPRMGGSDREYRPSGGDRYAPRRDDGGRRDRDYPAFGGPGGAGGPPPHHAPMHGPPPAHADGAAAAPNVPGMPAAPQPPAHLVSTPEQYAHYQHCYGLYYQYYWATAMQSQQMQPQPQAQAQMQAQLQPAASESATATNDDAAAASVMKVEHQQAQPASVETLAAAATDGQGAETPSATDVQQQQQQAMPEGMPDVNSPEYAAWYAQYMAQYQQYAAYQAQAQVQGEPAQQ